jgi:hypothetical protein
MKKIVVSLVVLMLLVVGCEAKPSSSSTSTSSNSSSTQSSVVVEDEVMKKVNETIYAFIANYASSYVSESKLDYVGVSILKHLNKLDDYADMDVFTKLVTSNELSTITTIGDAFKYSLLLSAYDKDLASYLDYDLVSKIAEINAVGPYQSLYGVMAYNNYKGTLNDAATTYLNSALADLTTTSSPKNATVDSGGTTLIALAPFYSTSENVKDVVNEYVNWVSEVEQLENGAVKDVWMGENSATIAQVIMGLVANGIDPRSEKFTKVNGDLVTALLEYALLDGSFKYQLENTESDLFFSTPQSILALVVYKLYKDTGSSVNAFILN